ncbi:LxmA leader domain family RiPP [Nocardiopsis changdeensis]|uniref:LxmA leader domain family RiPP n=1 Tax=Nocardiopsis changdeensis TaxID=2831969 RepID=A0ABX8BPI9_9ACTN|nr:MULTISPECIES: LxmA leader domain family RiPP [Nocardiopsis]QKW31878.1 hypothetical protein HUT17_02010 [Nocardiopsis flavescens]QUX23174.1 LxmA leader domain family RiPP [Nocardiopsis changdeensis]QYX39117.1 LxmA leader domain family RiPP [Nocardiopsis sp. MT53]
MSTESLMGGADDYTTPAEIADSAESESPEATLAPTPTLPTTLQPVTSVTVTTTLRVGC